MGSPRVSEKADWSPYLPDITSHYLLLIKMWSLHFLDRVSQVKHNLQKQWFSVPLWLKWTQHFSPGCQWKFWMNPESCNCCWMWIDYSLISQINKQDFIVTNSTVGFSNYRILFATTWILSCITFGAWWFSTFPRVSVELGFQINCTFERIFLQTCLRISLIFLKYHLSRSCLTWFSPRIAKGLWSF